MDFFLSANVECAQGAERRAMSAERARARGTKERAGRRRPLVLQAPSGQLLIVGEARRTLETMSPPLPENVAASELALVCTRNSGRTQEKPAVSRRASKNQRRSIVSGDRMQ